MTGYELHRMSLITRTYGFQEHHISEWFSDHAATLTSDSSTKTGHIYTFMSPSSAATNLYYLHHFLHEPSGTTMKNIRVQFALGFISFSLNPIKCDPRIYFMLFFRPWRRLWLLQENISAWSEQPNIFKMDLYKYKWIAEMHVPP